MPRCPNGTVALTGGTGFVGTNLLNTLVTNGFAVRALTRRPQPETVCVTWIEGDLTDAASLRTLCQDADFGINLAGLTKALNRQAFFDVNASAAGLLFDIAGEHASIKRLVHVSSLAAREPELSHYGASKAEADAVLGAAQRPYSWIAVRPPAIYGPYEEEILKLIRVAGAGRKRGLLPAPAGSKARAGFIHVQDLCNALTGLLRGGPDNRIVEIDDGSEAGYSMDAVARAIAGPDGKLPYVIPVPKMLSQAIGAVGDMLSRLSGTPTMINRSHMRYLAHPDWSVHAANRLHLDGWQPGYTLETGMAQTINWARKEGLIP